MHFKLLQFVTFEFLKLVILKIIFFRDVTLSLQETYPQSEARIPGHLNFLLIFNAQIFCYYFLLIGFGCVCVCVCAWVCVVCVGVRV